MIIEYHRHIRPLRTSLITDKGSRFCQRFFTPHRLVPHDRVQNATLQTG